MRRARGGQRLKSSETASSVPDMSANARLADLLLKDHGGLYEWCMDQRKGVSSKSWDAVAVELAEATGGQVKVGGRIVRNWCAAIEAGENL
ncbi:hypothetical protein GCM10028787_31360 [Brachybacterium horti]